MVSVKKFFGPVLAFLVLLGALAWGRPFAAAQGPPPRQTILTLPYTEYEWWLLSWETNEIQCRILTDHEGLPTSEDVSRFCGTALWDTWQNTPLCDYSGDLTACEGVYLYQVAFQPQQREVTVELPPPQVFLSLDGCNPIPPANLCPSLPGLLLTGEEPLPNEHIVAIRGNYAGAPFECLGDSCRIQLGPTPVEGVTIEFWAESSYGDESQHFTAQVRAIDTGVTAAPGGGGWYVDVISSQWTGAAISSCAGIWQSFPSVGLPPTWLSTPDQSALLASDEPYFYLAGRLIAQGLVDVNGCPAGGLLPNGYADACGLERARTLVDAWQNQFDQQIVSASQETGVPAQLIKNLFAQESQFWPGIFRVKNEFGLGQITDNGADSILIWNSSFYEQFCPLVLAADACAEGYVHLSAENRALLRGALAAQAKSDCPTCQSGIDLSNAGFSVSLFANTLQANCAQVNQTIFTATQQTAGAVASYEDLWRFTIANYHAGPGCLSYAIHSAWQSAGILNWPEVAARFTEPCMGVVPYVEKITR